MMRVLPYSLELQEKIFANITKQTEKEIARKIINCFSKEGFTINVKHMFPKKPSSFYRVFCFIKKSYETVTIDAKDGLEIRIRIENKNTFDRLSEFTDSIRNQIINAKDCINFNPIECEGKVYNFVFNGNEYLKCKHICYNFCFNDISKDDLVNIIDIIYGEIEYKKNQ